MTDLPEPTAAPTSRSPFDIPPQTRKGFEPIRGAWVILRLLADPRPAFTNIIHPAAIVGNLGGESGLKAIQEVHPMVEGSRGGFGWEQATGDRRRNFEAFVAEHGWKTTDEEANYEFLIWELCDDPKIKGDGSENRALQRLKQTTTLEAATYTFEVAFERPSSTSDIATRIKFAQQAMDAIPQIPQATGAVPIPIPIPIPTPTSSPSLDSDETAEELNRQELERLGIEIPPKPSAPSPSPSPSPAPNHPTSPAGEVTPASVPISQGVLEQAPGPTNTQLANQIPPARTSPGVGAAVTGGYIASLADTTQYFATAISTGQLQVPTDRQAMSLAAFIVTSGALLVHLWANRKNKQAFDDLISSTPTPTPTPTPTSVPISISTPATSSLGSWWRQEDRTGY